MLSDLLLRLRALFKGTAVDREIDEELRFHIERQIQAYENAGADHDEAVRRARIEFGGLDQVKEDYRDARGTRWIEETIQDCRFAARVLVKDRWFTAAVVLVLTLGISANNTVFTLVNAALIRDLPFEHADRVVTVGTRDARKAEIRGPLGYQGVSLQEYREWRGSATTLAGIAAYSDATMNISDDTRTPERFRGAYISANAFSLLGRQPVLGRDFRSDDDERGAPPVVILGYRVWTSRFDADSTIIGRNIRINGVPSVVVGVMPARFGFPLTADVWLPLAQRPSLFDQPRGARVLDAFGRLASGTTIAEAQSELDSIADRMAMQFPDTNTDRSATVWPYADRHVAPQVKLIIAALMGAVVFVLLIACANVANLLLARAAQRGHEIAIRMSLGATRWRIVRQLLTESVLLSAAGGAAGYALSMVGVKLLWSVLEGLNPPFWLELTMDRRTFAFLAAVCLGTAVLFGVAPALHASRPNVSEGLTETRRTTSGAWRVRRWASALVIVEVALTLVLLAGAGFIMRSFFRAYSARADIDTSQLLTARLDLPPQKYKTPDQRIAFVQNLNERVDGLHAVAAATIASSIPFAPGPVRELLLDSDTIANRNRRPRVATVTIGDQFFDTLNLRLVAGRAFTNSDGLPGHETAVVNRRLAALYFPNEDPIGRRIQVSNLDARGGTTPWFTVIGVAPTIRRDVRTDGDPVVYLPYRAQPASLIAVVIRTTAQASAIVPLLRDQVRALDGDLPLFDVKTLDERLAFARWPERVFGTMFAIFACIGLVMAGVGLYAVTAYSVKQRTQEIGVRMALGAAAPQVWWLIVRRVLAQLATGIMVGLPGAVIVGRLPWMGSPDPVILMAIVMGLVIVAGLASFLPARRATQLDPLCALRYE